MNESDPQPEERCPQCDYTRPGKSCKWCHRVNPTEPCPHNAMEPDRCPGCLEQEIKRLREENKELRDMILDLDESVQSKEN